MKEKQEKCISKKNIIILSTTAIVINLVILYLWLYEKLNLFDNILSVFIFVCNIILIYLLKYFNAFLLNIIHMCMSFGLFMSLFVDNFKFILLLLCVVIECQLVWIYTKNVLYLLQAMNGGLIYMPSLVHYFGQLFYLIN